MFLIPSYFHWKAGLSRFYQQLKAVKHDVEKQYLNTKTASSLYFQKPIIYKVVFIYTTGEGQSSDRYKQSLQKLYVIQRS